LVAGIFLELEDLEFPWWLELWNLVLSLVLGAWSFLWSAAQVGEGAIGREIRNLNGGSGLGRQGGKGKTVPANRIIF